MTATPTRPTLNASAFGTGPVAQVARNLYAATATRPLGPWASVPSPLLPYLRFVYGTVGDPLDIEWVTALRDPEPLENTGTCVVGFSGGKDSLAAAILASRAGYDVVLYHVAGINRAWPDERRYAQMVADLVGFPLVIEKVQPKGTKAGIPEPVAKNQIIMAGAVQWAQAHRVGPAFSMGMCVGDMQGSAHPLSYVHDTYDAHLNFGIYLEAAAPGFTSPLYLRGVTESTAVVAGWSDRRLLYAAHGCMAQMRFRPGYVARAVEKYGVRIMPGRCGVSCPKCTNEYIILAELGALEPEEYSDEMLAAAKKYLGTHPLYDEDARPDLANKFPHELVEAYREPALLDEYRRDTWPGVQGPMPTLPEA